MPHYKMLVGERCYLSPMSPEDAEKQAQWENDLEVAIPLGSEAYSVTAQDKVAEQVREAISREAPVFCIVDLASDQVIGRCLLADLDPVNQCAMLGIMIGEKDYWNLGYGQEAVRLLLEYAFDLLNVHSVMLGAFAYNERAIAAYRKVGFQEIGHRRQARIVAGQKYDVVLMDILADDFRALHGPGQVDRIIRDGTSR